MTDKTPSGRREVGPIVPDDPIILRGRNQHDPNALKGGYQPQVPGPVNLATLKPPRGGSAIERPEKPPAGK
jgi:hypothetical protein